MKLTIEQEIAAQNRVFEVLRELELGYESEIIIAGITRYLYYVTKRDATRSGGFGLADPKIFKQEYTVDGPPYFDEIL